MAAAVVARARVCVCVWWVCVCVCVVVVVVGRQDKKHGGRGVGVLVVDEPGQANPALARCERVPGPFEQRVHHRRERRAPRGIARTAGGWAGVPDPAGHPAGHGPVLRRVVEHPSPVVIKGADVKVVGSLVGGEGRVACPAEPLVALVAVARHHHQVRGLTPQNVVVHLEATAAAAAAAAAAPHAVPPGWWFSTTR